MSPRKFGQVNIKAERCKGCGFCTEFCPKHVLYLSNNTNNKGYHIIGINNNEECTACNICGMICPEFAITVVSIEAEAGKRRR